VTYRRGRISGAYERYDESGALDLGGTLIDGQPCGMWLEGPATITYPPCSETWGSLGSGAVAPRRGPPEMSELP
jgi:hypothetical protein